MNDNKQRIVVALHPDEFRQLEYWAHREEREPDQQATWVIRRALEQIGVALAETVPA